MQEWNVRVVAGEMPKQENSFDCGVFALQAALRQALREVMAFSQEDVTAVLRAQIALEIHSGKLLPLEDF
jgi:Ulp1 family protease